MIDNLDPLGILKSPQEREVAQNIADLLRPYSPTQRAEVVRKLHEKFDLDEAGRKMQALVDDSVMPLDLKKQLAQPILAEAEKERLRLEADLTHLHYANDKLRAQVEALRPLGLWLDKPPRLVLERNDCSRLHKLKEAARAGNIIDGQKKGSTGIIDGAEHILALEHAFVVKHDWGSAFANAQDVVGDFCLPYNKCVFEFRLDGHAILLWAQELEGRKSFTCFIETQGFWYCPPQVTEDAFLSFLWDQVRAICIALDAEVATHTVVRAPHRLNEKREKQGKPKLLDFHIVDLAKRHRVTNPSGATGGGGRKRLHFRRGHWRHFETSKTWVKWCLVGDPDLGFIQKSYTL